ncbi:MAG TPA: hypothetical protein VKA31_06555, partial [Mariprofundaceae bacterium]|nr:hypothetical protein [Mariprofundaceae bacterium]
TPPYGFVNFDVLDFDPEQPWDNYRALGVALNLPALVNGESTIKIQTAAIADGAVTLAKIPSDMVSGGYTNYEDLKSSVHVTTATPFKMKEFQVVKGGVLKVSFYAQQTAGTGGYSVYNRVQIYVNGVAVGTIRNPSPAGATYTEDITVADGDLVQIYSWCSTPPYYITHTISSVYTECAFPSFPCARNRLL